MILEGIANAVINWDEIPTERIEGGKGFVLTKRKVFENMSIRFNTYSSDFSAQDWCERGHILLVLSGVLIISFKDGTSVNVTKGNSFVIGSEYMAHKSQTLSETQVFIVD